MAKTFGKVIMAAALGAVAGLLFSPKSGQQNRKDLERKAKELEKLAKTKLQELKKSSKSSTRDVEKIANQASAEFTEFKETAQKHIQKASHDLKKVGLDAKRRSQHVTKDAQEAIKNHSVSSNE